MREQSANKRKEKSVQQRSHRISNPKTANEALESGKDSARARVRSKSKKEALVAQRATNPTTSSQADNDNKKRKDSKRKKSTTRRGKSSKRAGSCEKIKEDDSDRTPMKARASSRKHRSNSLTQKDFGKTYSSYRLRTFKPKKATAT